MATELIYKTANLLTYLNDRVFEKAIAQKQSSAVNRDKIKYILGFVERAEVILELSGSLAWGEPGRWTVVVVLQVIKSVCRLVILYQERKMLSYPAVAPVNRRLLIEGGNNNGEPKFTKLPRSGRVIQTISDGNVLQ